MIKKKFMFNYIKDSGSDSDPLADEMNIKEKLKSFIPEIIAK